MSEPLFLKKERTFEKDAVAKLSKNPDEWETEIIEMLHEQHPYLADAVLNVNLKKTDAESGAGIGQILVGDTAAIPVIIKDFKLMPFDVFYCDDQLHALKRETLESKIQQPTIGKPVKAKGNGAMGDVDIQGNVQPPIEGKYSYASALYVSKEDVSKALSDGLTDDGLRYEMATNPIFRSVVAAMMADKELPKEASASCGSEKKMPKKKKRFNKVASSGIYDVLTKKGMKTGLVFTDMLLLGNDELDTRSGASMFVSLDKTAHAITSDPIGAVEPATVPALPNSELKGTGVFWTIKEGSLQVTEPVKVLWTTTGPIDHRAEVQTLLGHRAMLEFNDKFPVIEKIAGTVYMPRSWVFTEIGEQTKLAKPDEADSVEWIRSIEVEPAIEKKAEAPVKVPFLLAKEKRALVKVAAMLDTDTCAMVKMSEEQAASTVDTLLNLNFINPQNISRFVESIDKLAETKQAVAELLLASKLGLDVDASPLRTALFALDQVERELLELRNSTHQ